jgi:hypothetical protein
MDLKDYVGQKYLRLKMLEGVVYFLIDGLVLSPEKEMSPEALEEAKDAPLIEEFSRTVANKKKRTFTIKTKRNVYETYKMTKQEFDKCLKYTDNDWKNFLLPKYYQIK